MVSHESLTGLFSLPADVSGMSRWRSRLLSERATALADALNRRSSRNYQRIVCTTRWAAAEFERIGAPNLRASRSASTWSCSAPSGTATRRGKRMRNQTRRCSCTARGCR